MAKACVIYSYPSNNSIHGSRLLQTVLKTLDDDKVQYELIDLYKQNFNPIMPESEAQNWGVNLPEHLKKYQEILKSSKTWIFVYPSWWSTPPAILKGFLDRVLTPGFSHTIKNGEVTPLLTGYQALILRTFSYSASQERKSASVTKSFMEVAVLNTCGIKSDEIDIYSVDSLAPTAFEHTLKYVPGAVRRSLVEPTGIPHHLRSIPAPYLPPVEDRGEQMQAEREEKEKKLSKDALSDLNYFRNARKKARRDLHTRSDRASATRYRFADDDSDFHPKTYTYTSRRNAPRDSDRTRTRTSNRTSTRNPNSPTYNSNRTSTRNPNRNPDHTSNPTRNSTYNSNRNPTRNPNSPTRSSNRNPSRNPNSPKTTHHKHHGKRRRNR